MKKKVLIFGAGATGETTYDDIKKDADVIGFIDNNSQKWGGTSKMPQFLEASILLQI